MKISLKSHHRAWRGERERVRQIYVYSLIAANIEWEKGASLRVHTINFIRRSRRAKATKEGKKRKESVARKKNFSFFFLAFHENCALASQHKKETYISTGNWKLFLTLDRHRPHPFHKFLFLFSTAPNTDRKEITVKIFPFKDQKSTRLTTIVSLSQTSQFFLFTSSFSTP